MKTNKKRQDMEKYIIQGTYPNGDTFEAEVYVKTCTDAFAMAQGLLKTTTLKETKVVSTIWGGVSVFR